jgi:hypothetical protein
MYDHTTQRTETKEVRFVGYIALSQDGRGEILFAILSGRVSTREFEVAGWKLRCFSGFLSSSVRIDMCEPRYESSNLVRRLVAEAPIKSRHFGGPRQIHLDNAANGFDRSRAAHDRPRPPIPGRYKTPGEADQGEPVPDCWC